MARVVRHFQPEQAPVGHPPDASRGDQVAGDMPRPVVEIAGVPGAEVVTVDQRAIEPQSSQRLYVPYRIGDAAVSVGLEREGPSPHRSPA